MKNIPNFLKIMLSKEKSDVKEKTNTETKESFKIKEQFKIKAQPPKPYKILLLNNNYTDFDAVVDVLKKVFQKSSMEAQQLMMIAHLTGKALVKAPVSKEEGEKLIDEAKKYCLKQEATMPRRNGGRPLYYDLIEFELESDDDK